MNDDLISMYIDDELGLDEKIVFVETVHQDENFKDDAVNLLQQEKLIRSEAVDHLPPFHIKKARSAWYQRLFRPMVAAAAAGLAVAAIMLFTRRTGRRACWKLQQLEKNPAETYRPKRLLGNHPGASARRTPVQLHHRGGPEAHRPHHSGTRNR